MRFGKILGMSTRKGSMVFLDSLVEEATQRMLENQGGGNKIKPEVAQLFFFHNLIPLMLINI